MVVTEEIDDEIDSREIQDVEYTGLGN